MLKRLVSAVGLALALSSAGVAVRAAEGATLATPVPVWNSGSGKLEAVLWIDTSTLDAPTTTLGTRWTADSDTSFSASLSARTDLKYGLLCGNRGRSFRGLGDGCLVAQLGRPAPLAAGSLSAQASASVGRSEWTAFGSRQHSSLDTLLPGTSLAPGMPELAPLAGLPAMGVEQNDLGIIGELRIGEQGWIRVGGSVARARLLPANSVLPGSVAPQWNSQTLSVGGGFGAIGGEVVGRVVRVPGEAESFGTLGLGLTWRTPWAGRLTVGAQNLLSTGENPLRPESAPERSEGRVPYVRYQQDL